MYWSCIKCQRIYPLDYEPDYCEDCGEPEGVLTRVIARIKREDGISDVFRDH